MSPSAPSSRKAPRSLAALAHRSKFQPVYHYHLVSPIIPRFAGKCKWQGWKSRAGGSLFPTRAAGFDSLYLIQFSLAYAILFSLIIDK